MEEIWAYIIKTTYAVCLPLALGYFGKQLKNIANDKADRVRINEEMRERFDSLCDRISSLETRHEETEMRSSRYRIIRFDDEMCSGISHSDDHCDQILEDIDIYSEYSTKHPDFKNHKGQGAMNRILEADKNGTLKGVR